MLELERLHPEWANVQQGLVYVLYTMMYEMSH